MDAGIHNLNIEDCNKEQNLILANTGYWLVQKQAKGVHSIYSPYHAYIVTCASFSSTPYPELLLNLKKQACRLIGHSNAGSCGMDSSGLLGTLDQVWLNVGRVATIIPLKQLKKLCPMVYDSTHNRGTFICHTKDSNIVLKTMARACPTLTSGSLRPKRSCPLHPKQPCLLCRQCEGTWRDSPSAKSRKRNRLARRKGCWGIPSTTTFW